MRGDPKGQKRTSGYIIGGCEPQCGCWEPNQAPLEEQPVQREVSVCFYSVGINLSETL